MARTKKTKRSKDKSGRGKRILIIVLVLFVLLAIAGQSGESDNSVGTDTQSDPQTQQQSESQDDSTSEATSEEVPDPTDGISKNDVVRKFINDYNATSTDPLQNFERGNIDEKTYGTSHGYRFEILDLSRSLVYEDKGEHLCVTITGDDIVAMRDAYREVMRTLNPDITDDEANAAFDSVVKEDGTLSIDALTDKPSELVPGFTEPSPGKYLVTRNVVSHFSASSDGVWSSYIDLYV